MTEIFPVIASTLDPAALSQEVLPGFGVDSAIECKYFSGGFNDTFRVTTKSETYYLRAYRKEWRTLADIQFELDVLNHLKRKGFPAARPVPYQDGNFFCPVSAPEGTRYLSLFTECSGPEISYDEEPQNMADRYGQAVAQMHNSLDDFKSTHLRFRKDITHFIDTPIKHVEPFLNYRSQDWDYFKSLAYTLRKKLLDLPVSELEQGVCHGDLQGYHAKVAPDGKLTFYDFDCGGYGYRAYDLAVFLWCCRLENAVEARWEPFLQAYRETRSIREVDVQAVPLFVCCRYLWHMGVHTQNAPDWGIGFLNDGYFDTHLERLRQAEEDYL